MTPAGEGLSKGWLESTGFELLERGSAVVVNEWPDVTTAVRAMAAAGPSIPAIEEIGYDAFCDSLRDAITPLFDAKVGVRISSKFGWVTARRA